MLLDKLRCGWITDCYVLLPCCRTIYDFDGELGQLDPASLGVEAGLDLAHVIVVGRKDYVLRSVHPQVRGVADSVSHWDVYEACVLLALLMAGSWSLHAKSRASCDGRSRACSVVHIVNALHKFGWC